MVYIQVLENPGPTKPQRMVDSPTHQQNDSMTPEGESSHLLSSESQSPPAVLPSSSTNNSLRATPINSTPLLSTTTSANRLATPPHRLLLETSFTCTPTASPEPPLDLRRQAHIHSPAITWELLSALEEQLLLGVREAGRGAGDRDEDWLAGVAPLASPETLSEASSVVSRHSLMLREGRRGSSALPALQQSPALNHRPPPARLGAGYCFYVETPPLDSRRQNMLPPEKLPESSDDEEISPRSITPNSYITIEPIMPTPPTIRKSNEPQSSNHVDTMPLVINDNSLFVSDPFTQNTIKVTPKAVQNSKIFLSRTIENKDKEEIPAIGKNGNFELIDSPGSGPSRASSSGSSQSSHRVKFDLTNSQISRDSGYGEKLNGYENLCIHTGDWGVSSGAFGGHQQEYGRGQSSLIHHYMYSGVSPQLSPSSPANTDSFTSPLTSDPPSSRPVSLLPTPVDIPQLTGISSSSQSSISTQCAHPLYKATPLLHDLNKISKPSSGIGYVPHRAESSV